MERRLTPEEIAAEFGHLSLAQIHAAPAYYHANYDEIESDIQAEEQEAERLIAEHRKPGSTKSQPKAFRQEGAEVTE